MNYKYLHAGPCNDLVTVVNKIRDLMDGECHIESHVNMLLFVSSQNQSKLSGAEKISIGVVQFVRPDPPGKHDEETLEACTNFYQGVNCIADELICTTKQMVENCSFGRNTSTEVVDNQFKFSSQFFRAEALEKESFLPKKGVYDSLEHPHQNLERRFMSTVQRQLRHEYWQVDVVATALIRHLPLALYNTDQSQSQVNQ